mgnify:CR=1 FL=1
MKQLSTRAKWAWALITIFVISYALFPIVSIFATSFKLPSQLNLGLFWPKTWTFVNYQEILAGISVALINSVAFAFRSSCEPGQTLN